MSRDDYKTERRAILDICCLCGKQEKIAVMSITTKACLCFKCLGSCLTQMGLQIESDGKNEPRGCAKQVCEDTTSNEKG